MQAISSSSASAGAPMRVSATQALEISTLKMQQDQQRADGEAAQELISSAAEVQMTGTGGEVDVVG